MATALLIPLLLALPSHADPVVDALQAELDRSVEQLALEDAQPPYFIAYDLLDTQTVEVQAVLGGLVRYELEPNRDLGVAVRVGSPEMDNANFSARGQGDGFGSRSLVIEDQPTALRHDAWLLTDREYKHAVENLARKQAERRSEVEDPDRPADFSPGQPHQAELEALPPSDAEDLASTARSLSAVFRDHPQIDSSKVYALSDTGRRVLLDSLGTRAQRPHGEMDLRVVASIRADDGAQAWDHASWYAQHSEQLPDLETMTGEVGQLTSRLEAWREAPRATDEYVGPVIFEGEAAVDLFRCLLVPHLSGTPPVQKAKDRFGRDKSSSQAFRLKRRVLPDGYSVVDDPQAVPTAPSAFAFDDEGVPAQRVQLVEDGVVRTLLSSRTPSEDVPESNGHGRAFPGRLARGLPSQLTVTPDRQQSWRRVVKQGLALAEDYDLDHVLVVRRLTDPSIVPQDGFFSFFGDSSSDQGAVPTPLQVVRLYADGREEPVRGLRFEALDRRSLRDIVAAGELHDRSFLVTSSGGPYGRGPTHGLPVTLTAPTVLLSEVALLPDEGANEKPPLLPSPLLEE